MLTSGIEQRQHWNKFLETSSGIREVKLTEQDFGALFKQLEALEYHYQGFVHAVLANGSQPAVTARQFIEPWVEAILRNSKYFGASWIFKRPESK